MSKVISTNQVSDNAFVVDYLVDPEEFIQIKETTIDELVKEVKLPGFRKGKVPKEKALAKIDLRKLENLILEKVFQKHEKAAVDVAVAELQQKGRRYTHITLNFENGATRENQDGSFQFQLVFHLMPEIDLSKLSEIKIREVKEDEIVGRPPLEEFLALEKDRLFCNYNRYDHSEEPSRKFDQVMVDLIGKIGEEEVFTEKNVQVFLGLGWFLPEIEQNLTGVKKGDQVTFEVNFPENHPNSKVAGKKVMVTAEVKSVLSPQYVSLEEVFEKSKQASELQKRFGSAANVDQYLSDVYHRETNRILTEMRNRLIIEEVMRVVPDFEIDENLIKTESERLLSQIKENADKNNLSVVQAAVRSYPVIASMLENQEESTEDELKQAFSKIIRDEYKWTSILSFVYQNKVTDKPKPEDLEKIQENAKKEPEMYGFRKDTPEEEIKNAIVDRVIRQVAFTWIVNQVTQANSQNLSAEQNQNTSNLDQDKKTKTKTKRSK
jgi:trigger factor